MFYFTVGPAALYPTCEQHYRDAFHQQIGSISHRSESFRSTYRSTDEQLRELMKIPSGHRIFFTASATEIWERIFFNLVGSQSFHFVQGAFSKKFYEFGKLTGKQPSMNQVADGRGFDSIQNTAIPDAAEIICFTQNETSSGIRIPEQQIHAIKKQHPHPLVCCDIVSAVPYVNLDYSLVDCAFFSVQKGMGMPPGLGVWIVNEACIQKASQIEQEGRMNGAHFRMSAFEKNYKTFETPSTPNTMAIYVLGKIAEDMNKKGIAVICNETDQKFDALYSFLSTDDRFNFRTSTKEHLSRTTLVCDTKIPASELNKKLNLLGMHLAGGYGEEKHKQIRIANFPSCDVDQMMKLIRSL